MGPRRREILAQDIGHILLWRGPEPEKDVGQFFQFKGLYDDGHKPRWPQTVTMTATAMKMWRTNAKFPVKLI